MIKNTIKMRSAFSMITAIFVILIMASVTVFIMNLSGKMIQETGAQYRKEQAILYAKSYTELAIMAATARNCITTITANVDGNAVQVRQGQGYRIIVNIQYVGNDNGCPNTFGGAITTNNSKGTIVLIDAYVHYRDPEHPNAIAGLPWANDSGITYHRRSLQRL